MESKDYTNIIGSISSREKMIRYLDGYAAERMEELDERKTKRPLVKSYLIEHTGDSDKTKPVQEIMSTVGINVETISDNLYRVYDRHTSEYIGFLETLTPRYFAVYTLHESQKSDKWIRNLILSCPELDHVWLSGLTFNVLWQRIVQLNRPTRYVRIMFLHDSIYQVDGGVVESEEEEASDFPDESDIVEIVGGVMDNLSNNSVLVVDDTDLHIEILTSALGSEYNIISPATQLDQQGKTYATGASLVRNRAHIADFVYCE